MNRLDGPHVLLITGEYPPATGGVGDYTALLAAYLRQAGLTVSIVAGPATAATDASDDSRPGRAPSTGNTTPPPNVRVRNWGFGSWRAIDRTIATVQPDLVHIQYQAGAFNGRGAIALLPWWLARRHSSPPLLVTFHDLLAPYLFPKAGRLRQQAIAALARGSAAVIVTNGGDDAQLSQDLMPADRPRLIPIGSNIPPAAEDAAARATLRADLGIAPDELALTYFGLTGASKGLDTLLAAVRRLVDTTPERYRLLVIGGSASPTDSSGVTTGPGLAGIVRELGLGDRVRLTGTLAPETVAAHLRAADLAVLPYRDGASWRRGSLLAALAQGLPVITTTPQPGYDARGCLPRLIAGENAVLVAPDDTLGLAEAIARAGADPAWRARLATGARALARHFAWETIAAAHAALYRDILNSPRRSPTAQTTGAPR